MEILQLQRAGIGTAAIEALLVRMQANVDDLCVQRDALKQAEPSKPARRKVLGGRTC